MTAEEDLLCITGSLYTVGEARAYFLSQGEIMRYRRFILSSFFILFIVYHPHAAYAKDGRSEDDKRGRACGYRGRPASMNGIHRSTRPMDMWR